VPATESADAPSPAEQENGLGRVSLPSVSNSGGLRPSLTRLTNSSVAGVGDPGPASPTPATDCTSNSSRPRRFWSRPRRSLAAAVVLLLTLGAGAVLAAPHVRAWHHLRAARAELLRFHNPQAIRHLQVCLRAWPEDPDVLMASARAARRARAYEESQSYLEKYQTARGCDEACAFEQLLLAAERNGRDSVIDLCRTSVEKGHPETSLIL
jgi:hypothetical protein